ncbi:hypothetical protein Mp_8g00980 [Marchantia polymorpha subsp. ruderalis]|uniref:Uncharacterized protein n=1 Tax=Marchantia polymorpha TaxID=3197 RepID=A0A2R6WRD6_MARPO|nr:hypothetical protein MARPO_0064s0100 [Marchantia polymorpha]BBN18248.1 hypothetical protein Mp_8g00980 [Marchantia polymorpha subsp. ruderalis]|eukprot:PTQ36425.1 hypothetical protein MARPO_0064s0100 [Marchantia polymorpha]
MKPRHRRFGSRFPGVDVPGVEFDHRRPRERRPCLRSSQWWGFLPLPPYVVDESRGPLSSPEALDYRLDYVRLRPRPQRMNYPLPPPPPAPPSLDTRYPGKVLPYRPQSPPPSPPHESLRAPNLDPPAKLESPPPSDAAAHRRRSRLTVSEEARSQKGRSRTRIWAGV